MAVPKYFEFFPYVLESLLVGEAVTAREIRDIIASKMHVSTEDRALVLPSGKQSEYNNRLNWAITYLKKANLVASPTRAVYQITQEGKSAYAQRNGDITLDYLKTIPCFIEFVSPKTGQTDQNSGSLRHNTNEETTPEAAMETASQQIKSSLVDELLSEVMRKSPDFFEKLVVDLLVKMGYGGEFENAGTVTKRSGDEGIDGIIREDKLGFNQIYVQAKRWDIGTTIGRPEIHRFYGALAGQGATKGLFVTTSRFSKEAVAFAKQQKIVLMDGVALANFMIDYKLGVSVKHVYEIKRIDTDFFNEDES